MLWSICEREESAEDDPAMALVTMSEIVLEQVLENAKFGYVASCRKPRKGKKGRNKKLRSGFKSR
jgi:hypothetical protein